MKKFPVFLLALIALIIGFTIHSVRHSEKQNSPQADSQGQAKSSRNRSHNDQKNQIKTLGKNLNSTGGDEAWFRWLAYLENASLSDLPNYVEQAGNDPVALSLIAERWVTLNPQDCFEYLLSLRESGDFSHEDSSGNLFSKLVFTKWAQRDLEAVVTALDHSEAPAGLQKLRKLVVDIVLETDVQKAFALGNRWKSFHSSQSIPPQLVEWAQRNPQAAVSAAFQISSNSFASPESPGPFLKQLSEIWGKKNPQAALEFALREGGIRGYRFGDLVFAQWASDDLTAASQWLSGLSDEQVEYFTPTFMKLWGESDPLAALDWSQELLSGRLLSESIQQVIAASARSEDVSPRDLLGRIESPEVHHQAVLALAHEIWGHGIRGGGFGDPQNGASHILEKISWFDDVDDPRTLNEIFISLTGPWSQADPEGFKTFLASERAQSVSPSRFGSAMYSLADDDPQETMVFIAGLSNKLIPEASAATFSVWHAKSPDEAIAWATQLSPNDPRRAHLTEDMRGAFTRSHQESVANLNAMPPIMKELYRADIASMLERGSGMRDKNGNKVDFAKLLEDTAE